MKLGMEKDYFINWFWQDWKSSDKGLKSQVEAKQDRKAIEFLTVSLGNGLNPITVILLIKAFLY